MRVPREKKMKSKKVRKFLPAIRCEAGNTFFDQKSRLDFIPAISLI